MNKMKILYCIFFALTIAVIGVTLFSIRWHKTVVLPSYQRQFTELAGAGAGGYDGNRNGYSGYIEWTLNMNGHAEKIKNTVKDTCADIRSRVVGSGAKIFAETTLSSINFSEDCSYNCQFSTGSKVGTISLIYFPSKVEEGKTIIIFVATGDVSMTL